MNKPTKHLYARSLLTSALLAVFSFNATAERSKDLTLFSAPLNTEQKTETRTEALTLGRFPIPDSQGYIIFIDEAPDAKAPSVSVVVVEDAGHNTLADAAKLGLSISELFQTYAPPRTKVPARIILAQEQLKTLQERTTTDLKVNTSMNLWSTTVPPIVGEDDWASGCNDAEAWDSEFMSWVYSFTFISPPTIFQTKTVDVPHATSGYGYFGLNDNIWAGVCMRSGEIMHVGIQFRNYNGNWVSVGGWSSDSTKADLNPGQRYLYHSFKPFTGQRRLYVSATGSADDGNGNWAIVSNAWRDDFAADGTFAYP